MNVLQGEPLILASQSATRQALLRNAGIPIEVVAAEIDERGEQAMSGLRAPGDIALHLARAKAAEVSARYSKRLVIGADQTLALGTQLFNKAKDRAAAAAQLRALSGETHELHSAVAVFQNEAVLFENVAIARMTMRSLADAEIESYLDLAGGAVLGSVGAYQLEGLGANLFSRVEGDHFTILGLPLLPLLSYLRDARVRAF